MNDPNICLRCGLELPAGMPQDGCQRCLLHAGLMAADDEVPVPAEANSGTMIGRYKLLSVIGEGGFGVVWRAEQLEPVSRQVALKVIKPGMDTGEVIARFEAERQALAMMDHPGIARVLDGGATEHGRPYFVMELVQGVPITRFCEDSGLTVRQRIELLVDVLSAVQHAHQKGIIHRDLKPSNILVSGGDLQSPSSPTGSPSPSGSSEVANLRHVKIIDFGIARAISVEMAEIAKLTLRGQIIGTPEYMSPEQAERKAQDVDTRSDIYSLGVVLYELLTGCTPLDHGVLREAGYEEILRRIREEDPPKPSTRVTSLGDRRHKLASQHGSETAKMSKQLRGDLDWIVMKALEKDRNRRYETANGFAMDLRRFLASEPVIAAPPSTGYMLAKLLRRHRTAFAAGAAVALTLITGICVSAWQAVRASNAELQAKHSERSAKQSEANALFRRAFDLQRARIPGYRREVWKCLHEVAMLDSSRIASHEFRSLVIACLGDPVGLEPVLSPLVERPPANHVAETLRKIIRETRKLNPKVKTAVSKDGNLLALNDKGNRLELWGNDGRMVAETKSPLSFVHDLEFTSDGELLVGGCEEGTVVWSVPDLRIRTFFRGGVVRRVACHPGGHRIASFLSFEGLFEVWSLASNRQVGSFPVPEGVSKVEFSADGKLLLAISSNGEVISGWSVDQTPEKQQLEGHEGGIPAVAFSPDGQSLASVSKDKTVRIWNVRDGKLRHICRGPKGEIQDVAFNPDGGHLVTGDWHGGIWVWDINTGRGFAAGRHPGQIWRLRFDSSGRRLFSAGADGVVCWDFDTAKEPNLTPARRIPFKSANDFAVHPDCSRLVVQADGGGVYSYDLNKADQPARLALNCRIGYRTLQFAGKGSHLLFVTPDSELGTWDFDQGTAAADIHRTVAATGTAIPANGRWAALMPESSRMVTIYDLHRNRGLVALGPEPNQIWCAEWTQDGSHLAVGLSDGGLAIWNLVEVRAQLAEFGIEAPATWEESERAVSAPKLASEPREVEPLRLQEVALDRLRSQSGPTHPKTLMAMYNLASAQDAAGRAADATALRTEIEKIPPPRDQLDVSQLPLLELWGRYHVRLGQWSEVAADLSRKIELRPKDLLAWSQFAVVLVETGDLSGYREQCRKMLSRFRATADLIASHWLARSCLLVPLAGDEFAVACKLANQVVERYHPEQDKLLVTKALAEYRQKNYATAVAWSRKALAKGEREAKRDAQVRAVLAMSLLRLGQADEAKAALAEAAKGLETKVAKDPERGDVWNDFHNGLIAGILLREAQALIEGDSSEK